MTNYLVKIMKATKCSQSKEMFFDLVLVSGGKTSSKKPRSAVELQRGNNNMITRE
jgi:hypothetical protein